MKMKIMLRSLIMLAIVAGVSSMAFGSIDTLDAGPDQEVWLADAEVGGGGVQLDSSFTTSGSPETIDLYTWGGGFDTCVPNAHITADDPIVTFTAGGVYELTLDIVGSKGTNLSDTVTITVADPVIDAGSNQTVVWGDIWTTGIVMDSTLSNPHSSEIYTYTWTSDPSTGVVFTPNETTAADDPTVTFAASGVYVLTLDVTGSVSGALVPDTVTITVNGPTIDAGSNQTVVLGDASTTGVALDSTLSNPYGGEILTYLWSVPSALEDPNYFGVVITNTNDEDPTVKFATVGVYELTLLVTGDAGADTEDTVTITVNGPNINAGGNQSVTLGAAYDTGVLLNSTLSGSYGGEIYTYLWSSVPSTGVAFENTAAADPNVWFEDSGVYVLTLLVTGDIGANTEDTVTITVNQPGLDAGSDRTVAFFDPTIIALDSTFNVNDAPDGEIHTYLWTSDDPNATFENTTIADPNVTFTDYGAYVLTLTVTGDKGTDTFDTVSFFITSAKTWVGFTGGDWHTSANWTDPNGVPTGVPDAADIVNLGKDSAEDLTVTVVYIDGAANAYSIRVGEDPNNPFTVEVNAGNSGASLTTVTDLNIAPENIGIVNLYHGAPLTVGDDLLIGNDGDGTLSALTDPNIIIDDDLEIGGGGDDGLGTLTMTGGALTVGGKIIIGDDGEGTLSALFSSTIIIKDDLEVGDNGVGTFNMTGGTLTVTDNIHVSKDDNNGVVGRGTGDMTLIGVTVSADDIYVASSDSDGNSSGVGTLTLTDCDVVLDPDGTNGSLKIGEYGRGIVTITRGTLDITDDLYIANEGLATGDGLLTLNDAEVRVDNKLDIGKTGIGKLVLNGTTEITDISDNLDLGSGTGTGTITMNDSSSIEVGKKTYIGKGATGTLNMNDTSYFYSDDQMRIGDDSDVTGYVYMNGLGTILETAGSEDLHIGDDGTGIVVTKGTIIVGDDLYIAKDSDSTGSLTIDGSLSVTWGDGGIVFADDDTSVGCKNRTNGEIIVTNGGILITRNMDLASGYSDDGSYAFDGTSRGDLTVNTGGEVYVDGGKLQIAHRGRAEIKLTGSGTFLGVGIDPNDGYPRHAGSNRDIDFAENPGSIGLIELRDWAKFEINGRIFVAIDGGNGTIDVKRGTLDMDEDLYLGGNTDDDDDAGTGDGGGTALLILDRGNVVIDDDLHMGGAGSTARIELVQGNIDVGGNLVFPMDADGLSTIIILGRDDNTVAEIGGDQSKLEVNDDPDFSNADPAKDYIDFLAGGMLDFEADPNDGVPGGIVADPTKITAVEIETLIASGVFRTTYSQPDIQGVFPVLGGGFGVEESFQVLYRKSGGGTAYEIYLGIALTPNICHTPPKADLDGDCIVDLRDFAIMALQWANDTSI